MDKSKIKILLVEDHPIARKVSALILSQHGCQVDSVDNAVQALEHVTNKHYDIVLVDLGLPDIDGLTLIKKIKEILGATHLPQIIILTAHESDVYKNQAAAMGINTFIVKPLTFEKSKQILEIFANSF